MRNLFETELDSEFRRILIITNPFTDFKKGYPIASDPNLTPEDRAVSFKPMISRSRILYYPLNDYTAIISLDPLNNLFLKRTDQRQITIYDQQERTKILSDVIENLHWSFGVPKRTSSFLYSFQYETFAPVIMQINEKYFTAFQIIENAYLSARKALKTTIDDIAPTITEEGYIIAKRGHHFFIANPLKLLNSCKVYDCEEGSSNVYFLDQNPPAEIFSCMSEMFDLLKEYPFSYFQTTQKKIIQSWLKEKQGNYQNVQLLNRVLSNAPLIKYNLYKIITNSAFNPNSNTLKTTKARVAMPDISTQEKDTSAQEADTLAENLSIEKQRRDTEQAIRAAKEFSQRKEEANTLKLLQDIEKAKQRAETNDTNSDSSEDEEKSQKKQFENSYDKRQELSQALASPEVSYEFFEDQEPVETPMREFLRISGVNESSNDTQLAMLNASFSKEKEINNIIEDLQSALLPLVPNPVNKKDLLLPMDEIPPQQFIILDTSGVGKILYPNRSKLCNSFYYQLRILAMYTRFYLPAREEYRGEDLLKAESAPFLCKNHVLYQKKGRFIYKISLNKKHPLFVMQDITTRKQFVMPFTEVKRVIDEWNISEKNKKSLIKDIQPLYDIYRKNPAQFHETPSVLPNMAEVQTLFTLHHEWLEKISVHCILSKENRQEKDNNIIPLTLLSDGTLISGHENAMTRISLLKSINFDEIRPESTSLLSPQNMQTVLKIIYKQRLFSDSTNKIGPLIEKLYNLTIEPVFKAFDDPYRIEIQKNKAGKKAIMVLGAGAPYFGYTPKNIDVLRKISDKIREKN